jgi:hypothetical protein
MDWAFEQAKAAARKEMQEQAEKMRREREAKGIPEPPPAKRAPVSAAPAGITPRPVQGPGEPVCQGSVGMRSVTIYSNGYVRVGMLGGGQIEKLIAIEYSANVQKKSAAGRGAAAVLTGGLNLLGSKQRGDVWLTIVSERTTYTLPRRSATPSCDSRCPRAGRCGTGRPGETGHRSSTARRNGEGCPRSVSTADQRKNCY